MDAKAQKSAAPKYRCGARPVSWALAWVLLALVISLTAGTALAQLPPGASHRSNHEDPSDDSSQSNSGVPQPLTPAQKHSLMRANFVRSRKDAADLAALAKGLREALDKPNADVSSVEVVSRAAKIEKLAKKIRDETTGF